MANGENLLDVTSKRIRLENISTKISFSHAIPIDRYTSPNFVIHECKIRHVIAGVVREWKRKRFYYISCVIPIDL